jgi:ElaB/YqjD/DUF883 family membrane-anchored ribosome-binding protein
MRPAAANQDSTMIDTPDARQAITRTRDHAHQAVNHMASTALDAMHGATPLLRQVADSVSGMASNGMLAMREGRQRIGYGAQRASDQTLAYIHHRPVRSVLVAAATGAVVVALLSLVFSRRSPPNRWR